MKKTLFIVLLMALMGGAFAQNEGTTEYVSALITFRDGSNVPQDSLNKYGVIIQTREGRMANALIEASLYQAFLNANLVERVTPSTRVVLLNNQKNSQGVYSVDPTTKRSEVVKEETGDVRRHIIPEQDIRNDEAKGWYVGLMLGGSSNTLDVQKTIFNGQWYSYRGLNLEARAGYQFNEWFGIRTGLALISKNYATKLNVSYNDVEMAISIRPTMPVLTLAGPTCLLMVTTTASTPVWPVAWVSPCALPPAGSCISKAITIMALSAPPRAQARHSTVPGHSEWV